MIPRDWEGGGYGWVGWIDGYTLYVCPEILLASANVFNKHKILKRALKPCTYTYSWTPHIHELCSERKPWLLLRQREVRGRGTERKNIKLILVRLQWPESDVLSLWFERARKEFVSLLMSRIPLAFLGVGRGQGSSNRIHPLHTQPTQEQGQCPWDYVISVSTTPDTLCWNNIS